MTLAGEYYVRGFLQRKLKGSSREQLVGVMEGLFNDGPKEGFTWEQKYPGTLDLRPNAHLYDPAVLDVLIESDIPSLLHQAVGSDYVLFHTQIRKSFPGPSYMDWHRDSYDYGKPVGNFPPAHKVIFYPCFKGIARVGKLKLCAGSHLRHFSNQQADLTSLKQLPIKEYVASEDEFMLFNTSILHGAIDEATPSIRLIYSFIRRVQFEELYADQPIHAEQVRMYEERLTR